MASSPAPPPRRRRAADSFRAPRPAPELALAGLARTCCRQGGLLEPWKGFQFSAYSARCARGRSSSCRHLLSHSEQCVGGPRSQDEQTLAGRHLAAVLRALVRRDVRARARLRRSWPCTQAPGAPAAGPPALAGAHAGALGVWGALVAARLLVAGLRIGAAAGAARAQRRCRHAPPHALRPPARECALGARQGSQVRAGTDNSFLLGHVTHTH